MAHSTHAIDTVTTYEAARAFLDGSTSIFRDIKPQVNRYQLDGYGHVFVEKENVAVQYRLPVFIGGVAYSLAEQGVLPTEEAGPDYVAEVCFELGVLVTKNEVGHVSAGPLA